MTAAIESLHIQFPGRFITGISTSVPAIFENNPHIVQLDYWDRHIKVDYGNGLCNSDHRPIHFIQAFTNFIGEQLEVPLEPKVKRPYLYLTELEKHQRQIEGKYWLMNAGYKSDYTVKKWKQDYWQEVVSGLPEVRFVQVGESSHNHRPLHGVIDMIGRTNAREFIRLAYHCSGAITPESYLHHLMAAFGKPCVTLASGFLPVNWVRYHTGVILTNQPYMTCCQQGKGCWKSRVVPLHDGDGKDHSLCTLPVLGADPVARCMDLISPQQVIDAVRGFWQQGCL